MQTPELTDVLDFRGKVVLVTGGSRGIGAGVALRFARAGAAVLLGYLSAREAAQKVVGRIAAAGGVAEAQRADVGRAQDVERLVSQTVARFGRLDVLVNNAGIYPVSPLLDLDDHEWRRVVDANLTGVHFCTRRAAQAMAANARDRGAGGESGSIVNISSIEASSTAAGHSHYSASKAGVEQYTRNAALELAPAGIRVNSVAPGLIGRPGLAEEWPDGVARWLGRVPLGRLGTPEDIADACLFLASPMARWITGVTLTVDGGIQVAPPF